MTTSGKKSFVFRVRFTWNSAGTGLSFENILAGNGLTVISPLTKNVIIDKISAYSYTTPRSATSGNTAGYQNNNFQIEFNLVDFAGQIIKDGFGFINLFVPNPNIVPTSLDSFDYALNQLEPSKEFKVLGGGLFIKSIRFLANGLLGVATNYTTDFVITVDYFDPIDC
jgi:hypothetical protein